MVLQVRHVVFLSAFGSGFHLFYLLLQGVDGVAAFAQSLFAVHFFVDAAYHCPVFAAYVEGVSDNERQAGA